MIGFKAPDLGTLQAYSRQPYPFPEVVGACSPTLGEYILSLEDIPSGILSYVSKVTGLPETVLVKAIADKSIVPILQSIAGPVADDVIGDLPVSGEALSLLGIVPASIFGKVVAGSSLVAGASTVTSGAVATATRLTTTASAGVIARVGATILTSLGTALAGAILTPEVVLATLSVGARITGSALLRRLAYRQTVKYLLTNARGGSSLQRQFSRSRKKKRRADVSGRARVTSPFEQVLLASDLYERPVVLNPGTPTISFLRLQGDCDFYIYNNAYHINGANWFSSVK
jgi:hypothetical protein